jgi:acetylornithine deacetylase/succinyl-diaminopimelate desuccinylase-like protein
MNDIIAYVESNHERYLSQLKELLAIPSVSSQTARKPEMRRAAEWLADHMSGIGLHNIQILETEGHPVVYADWLGAPGKPVILLYGHYDVQPEDPVDQWQSPPFEATVRDGNLYARGAADDKGQVFIHLKAIEAFLKNRRSLPVNIKLMIEAPGRFCLTAQGPAQGRRHTHIGLRHVRRRCAVRELRLARTGVHGSSSDRAGRGPAFRHIWRFRA